MKDVAERKDRAWLVGFIRDPSGVIASGDAYAKKILAAANGVPMPPIVGMTKDRAEALLDLIEAESAKEKSQFAGSALPERPLTDEDLERGRRIFLGTLQARARLVNNAMKIAAAEAIAGFAEPGALVPSLLHPDVHHAVAEAVQEAALSSGAAAEPTPKTP